jgi:hypothetical protein
MRTLPPIRNATIRPLDENPERTGQREIKRPFQDTAIKSENASKPRRYSIGQ